MVTSVDEKAPQVKRSATEANRSGKRPLVSILINNYNYAPFLSEAIDSALSQTFRNVEVVVVDDGSTDCSREVIKRYGNRIIPVMKENGGQASAFNAGFAASKGDIVCFLDSDDLFLPEKVSGIVEIFTEHPSCGWCFDNVHHFDDKNGERYPPPAPWKFGPWDVREMIAGGRAPYFATATSGLSFRRSTLDQILPMPEIIRITSDGYLKLAALGLAEGWMASEEFTLQRIHGENAYTRRKAGRMSIMGLTGVLTGVCLHERYPSLRRLAITLFSRGLGTCWIVGAPKFDYREFCGSFLRRAPLRTRAEILLRATYSSIRLLLSGYWREWNLAVKS